MTSACSLHSLQYLGAGGSASSIAGDASTGGDVNATGGDPNATGGDSNGGVSATAGGGVDAAGGVPDAAGAAGAGAEAAKCSDQEKDGEETDVDCGGRSCAPCGAGNACTMGTDCQSAICTNVECQAPSCTDLALNGSETDLNCGGSCPACDQGKHCSKDADCSTGNCKAGICESRSCVDGVLVAGCPLLVDNTPYSLSPAKGMTNCIDDEKDSVADGNAVLLHACQDALRQTFWAVARTDGYFALRNALSGKCLHVRGASTAGGAVIEQATCSFAFDQLWKPSLVNSSLMALTSHFSGLSLNVAGDSAGKDGQAIVQGQVDNSADTQWRVSRRSVASYVTFSPAGELGVRIQHSAEVVTLASDDLTNAQWIVVPGLNDASLVSFQSRNDPGRYLRHAHFSLWSDTNDGTATFKLDATFRYDQPFVGSSTLAKALESVNFPGRYWNRTGTTISLTPFADTADYKTSATWQLSGR
ncbi:MAG: AbfB domain-containing protein [Pseudomonadota bacterium]